MFLFAYVGYIYYFCTDYEEIITFHMPRLGGTASDGRSRLVRYQET